eukprot:1999726-Prymnesium_polylepis.1
MTSTKAGAGVPTTVTPMNVPLDAELATAAFTPEEAACAAATEAVRMVADTVSEPPEMESVTSPGLTPPPAALASCDL